ncbi:MAG: HNH endonuclease signature motif containing protein [Patescibacteria group bacterium]
MIKDRRHVYRSGLHIHHKKPLSKGGDNRFENLIALCQNCHANQHEHLKGLINSI